MANPQLEKGYLRLANDLFEALMLAQLHEVKMTLVMYVIRMTYGYNRSEAQIRYVEVAEELGLRREQVSRQMRVLRDLQLIRLKRCGKARVVSLQKDFEAWKCDFRRPPSSITNPPVGPLFGDNPDVEGPSHPMMCPSTSNDAPQHIETGGSMCPSTSNDVPQHIEGVRCVPAHQSMCSSTSNPPPAEPFDVLQHIDSMCADTSTRCALTHQGASGSPGITGDSGGLKTVKTERHHPPLTPPPPPRRNGTAPDHLAKGKGREGRREGRGSDPIEEVLEDLSRRTKRPFPAHHPNGGLTPEGQCVADALALGYGPADLIWLNLAMCSLWWNRPTSDGRPMRDFLRPRTLYGDKLTTYLAHGQELREKQEQELAQRQRRAREVERQQEEDPRLVAVERELMSWFREERRMRASPDEMEAKRGELRRKHGIDAKPAKLEAEVSS